MVGPRRGEEDPAVANTTLDSDDVRRISSVRGDRGLSGAAGASDEIVSVKSADATANRTSMHAESRYATMYRAEGTQAL